MKQLINETINKLQDTFYDVSKYIGQNPELGHEEFKACKALTDVLKEQGFTVEIGTCDLPTALPLFMTVKSQVHRLGLWQSTMLCRISDTHADIT